jgi:hypothetical protein
MLTFEDLERLIINVLHEHDMVTPALAEALTEFDITRVINLCDIPVCFFLAFRRLFMRAGLSAQAS